MDLSINQLHSILLDAGLPSSVEDLKNPREEYIINLLTAFLSQFGIDMDLISQPIPEQSAVMSYSKNPDIIRLINLHVVMFQIFNKIFLNDFSITDITSPGQKRPKRQAKFLANFVLYMMQKKSEFSEEMDKIQSMSRSLEELREKKLQTLESINNKAVHRAKQLSSIKKMESDIQEMELNIEKINKKELELEVMKNNTEKENQKAKEFCGSVKTTAAKLSKAIAELQSQIVHSPEEYQSRLNDLEEQKNLKVEERDIMQKAIQDKKQSIKQIGEKLNFVKKVDDELAVLKTVYQQLKNQKAQLDNVKKKSELLSSTWDELQNKLTMHKNQVDTEMNDLQLHREEDITPLYNLYTELLSEKKVEKNKFEISQARFNDKCLERNKLQVDIKNKEEETVAFASYCQEIYDNEITNELELQESWNKN